MDTSRDGWGVASLDPHLVGVDKLRSEGGYVSSTGVPSGGSSLDNDSSPSFDKESEVCPLPDGVQPDSELAREYRVVSCSRKLSKQEWA